MDRYNNSRGMRMVELVAKNKESHKKPARKSEEDDPDFELPSSLDKSSSS